MADVSSVDLTVESTGRTGVLFDTLSYNNRGLFRMITVISVLNPGFVRESHYHKCIRNTRKSCIEFTLSYLTMSGLEHLVTCRYVLSIFFSLKTTLSRVLLPVLQYSFNSINLSTTKDYSPGSGHSDSELKMSLRISFYESVSDCSRIGGTGCLFFMSFPIM